MGLFSSAFGRPDDWADRKKNQDIIDTNEFLMNASGNADGDRAVRKKLGRGYRDSSTPEELEDLQDETNRRKWWPNIN